MSIRIRKMSIHLRNMSIHVEEMSTCIFLLKECHERTLFLLTLLSFYTKIQSMLLFSALVNTGKVSPTLPTIIGAV